EQFKNPGAPTITGAAATFATDRTIDRLAGRETQKLITRVGDEVLLGKFVPILAAAAEDADQPLGNDGAQGRSQQNPRLHIFFGLRLNVTPVSTSTGCPC